MRATPPRKKRRYGPKPGSTHNLRRLLGARLRKAVKAKDLRAKITILLALAQDGEAEIADAARRLSQRFTRLCGGVPLFAFVAVALARAFRPFEVANSS